jgi:hypothetical protein
LKTHACLLFRQCFSNEVFGGHVRATLNSSRRLVPVVAGGLKHLETIEVPPYHYGALFERSGP